MKRSSTALKTIAIIPSGGLGLRMGGKRKNYLHLLGRPILAHTLAAFEDSPHISSIIIAVPPGDEGFCLKEIVERHGISKTATVVAGGKERQDSVLNALSAVQGHFDIIAVHDGARPLVTGDVIERTVGEAARTGAAICAVRVKDTIKDVREGLVVNTVPRDGLWAVQTPQAFHGAILKDAFRKADKDGYLGTDESSLVERLGVKVSVVEGAYENIKITTPDDLAAARCILEGRGAPRRGAPRRGAPRRGR